MANASLLESKSGSRRTPRRRAMLPQRQGRAVPALAEEFHRGAYVLSEVSAYTQLPMRVIRRLVSGGSLAGRLFVPSLGRLPNGHILLSFPEMVTVGVAGLLLQSGVRLADVIAAHALASRELKSPLPFAAKGMRLEGRRLFANDQVVCLLPDGKPGAHLRELSRLLASLEYLPVSGMATVWNISGGVIIDPRKRWGGASLAAHHVPTSIVLARWRASKGDAESVGADFGLPKAAVELALAFEKAHRLVK